jgi:Putative zinc-finger
MTEPLTHTEVEQLLPAAALEILEGGELARLATHLEDCADCTRLLDAYREVVAGLAGTLPEQPFHPARSERLRGRLLARTGRIPIADVPERRRRSPAAADRWIGWVAAAALAGVLMVHHSVHRPVAYGWLAAGLLMLLLLGLGVYVRVQRTRTANLEDRLASLVQRSQDGTTKP